MNTMSRRKQIIDSLATKEGRQAFVEANVETGISFQIRANRLRRKWSQEKLGDLAGKKQPYIARMEGPKQIPPNVRTLLDFAAAYDCALIIRFVPFSELVNWVAGLHGRDLSTPSFDEDDGLGDRR